MENISSTQAIPQASDNAMGEWLRLNSRPALLALVALLAVGVAIFVAGRYQSISHDTPLYAQSTLGLLAGWMTEQSAVEQPVSFLGQYSRQWALQAGTDQLAPAVLADAFQRGLIGFCLLLAGIGIVGIIGIRKRTRWQIIALLGLLLGLDMLIFIIPPIDNTVYWVMLAITLLALGLLFLPRSSNRIIGFLVILSLLIVAWEGMKSLASQTNYAVTLAVDDWDYTPYPTREDTLQALVSGAVDAVILDRRDVEESVPTYPLSADTAISDYEYPALAVLNRFDANEQFLAFPITPTLPGRLRVVVRSEDAERWTSTQALIAQTIGTTAGEFADERFLSLPREATVLDLKIFNDINLPHLQTIASSMLQPARRNGSVLLLRILVEAGMHTWEEAIVGFGIGAVFGFVLGTALAHSAILQRGLLPYVIASQTIPIIAIAPILVIWLGAGPVSIAIIASYLTFFPVTINTLRGLRSVDPTALELMQSYAASRWAIMWKLRFPAALPYIFTALKVSATASVVGAIVGELPSGVRDGLGRAILNFSSDYSAISTPKLWGAIFIASAVGIIFFLIVSLIESVVLRGRTAK